MAKIVYPDTESLSSLVINPLNDTLQCLNNALNYCSFTVPGDFAYLSYLRTLGSNISKYGQEITKIYKSIESIDKSYRSAFDTLDTYRERLNLNVIEERTRLVK